jgi:hypothetical protein
MPAIFASITAVQDKTIMAELGLAAFSLALMIATVLSRKGSLPAWFVTHIDASGRPDQWGTPSAIWRVPFMAAMLTLSSVLTAAFIAKRDAFAARFLVSATLLVHVLAWIALVRLLW